MIYETANIFLVGVKGERIAIQHFKREMTKLEALNLAAYLVTLADDKKEFANILEQVQNT